MANIYDMVDTWNAGATTFTAIKMNVTDTASAAGSALMDLQLAGTTVLRLQKNGVLQFGGTTSSFPGLRASGANLEVRLADNSAVGNLVAMGAYLGSGGVLALGNDTVLARDAANALAQRNGTIAQSFRVYNTFTDASNYERGVFDWSTTANALTIGTQRAGAAATRVINFITGGGQRLQIGAAAMTCELGIVFGADNTYDIGASGANRPRNLFVAGSITAGPAISTMNDTGVVTWGASNDVILTRDAASVLAQRNSTNPQVFRVYNTFTDGSNYERGVFDWSTTTNVLIIGTQQGGTGAARTLRLLTQGDANLQFFTNGTQRFDISSIGLRATANLIWTTDNTFDIGASGANRPRNLYMGSWIRMATTVVASLPAAATAGAGARMFVTDALTPVFGSAVTGGGAVTVPVYSTGSAWNVG